MKEEVLRMIKKSYESDTKSQKVAETKTSGLVKKSNSPAVVNYR